MRSGWIVALIGLALTAAALPGQGARGGKPGTRFVPPKGSCLLVVGQDKASIDEHVAKLKVRPAGVMAYTSLQRLEGLTKPEQAGGLVQDAGSLLETYPHSVLQLGLYLVGALEGVVAGKYDENIDRLAEWVKASKRPVFLRVGYEFDFPENKYPPDLYVRAFRRIRDRMESRGATNVAYVWHSYAAANSKGAADWYPGDGYVDWVAVSYFSPKQSHLETVAQFARQRGKPLMVAEATPRGVGTVKGRESWESWFVPCLRYLSRHDVRAFCYIDKNWEAFPRWQGKGWGDTRIDANALVRANWLKEVGGKRYLKASESLFSTLGYPPPRE
jgi:Glycosyl hydrolase family 26